MERIEYYIAVRVINRLFLLHDPHVLCSAAEIGKN